MRKGLWVLALAMCGALAACDDAEERAERIQSRRTPLVYSTRPLRMYSPQTKLWCLHY